MFGIVISVQLVLWMLLGGRGPLATALPVQIVLSMLLGGRGTLWGPVLGAFIIEPVNEFANQSLGGGNSRLLIFGGLMALVVLFMPNGIVPFVGELLEKYRRRGEAAIVGARLEAPLVMREGEEAPVGHGGTAGRAVPSVRGIEKRFGGLRAVDGCSFAVPEGSITALIGPNGSGKTTAFNLIDGTMAPGAGEVWFDGRRIDGLSAYRRAHLGLGRTFQITRLFRDMTVLENVVAPLREFSWRQLNAGAVRGDEAERAMELQRFVGRERFPHQKAGARSYAQQTLAELSRGLMLGPNPTLLAEPGGGSNPTLSE